MAGSTSMPPPNPHTSSAVYDRCGATTQNAASPNVVTASIGRRPNRSTTRPITGAPTAIPMVHTAPTVPAAP